MHRTLFALLAVSSLAIAQDGPYGAKNLSLSIGGSAEVMVGVARGLLCDDLTIVAVEIKSGPEANYLEVKGLKAGVTMCRVGTGQGGPSVTLSIVVQDPKQPLKVIDAPKLDAAMKEKLEKERRRVMSDDEISPDSLPK